MQKKTLGIAAVAMLVSAVAIWLWGPATDSDAVLAFCWRAGALSAVAWLAYDDVQRLPNWLLLGLPVLLIVLARWPKMLVPLIPLLVLCEVVRRVLRK
ncbi:MAG: hypothetical protein LLG00_08015 [Planctomycetaceae bacterium]|nr:hypothetical protein [Planctomycetaceae bacterium]